MSEKRNFSWIEKLLIKWQTRSLGQKIHTLMLILSVLVYMGRPNFDERFKQSKSIINKMVKLSNLASKVYDRVVILVSEYAKDEKIYMQNRDKAIKAIVEDIQLYGIVLDMLKDKKYDIQREMINARVQKVYDDTYKISNENKRILEYQEQNFK